MLNPKEAILAIIKESTDNGIKGTAYKNEEYLRRPDITDSLDLVLYYIGFQPDVENLGKIDSNDFWDILEAECKKCVKYNKDLLPLLSGWSSSPGPGNGGAGLAEIYAMYYPGITRYDTLSTFFSYNPQKLNQGWKKYRDGHIKNYVFPKWRRNIKKADRILNLAEVICDEIRIELAKQKK